MIDLRIIFVHCISNSIYVGSAGFPQLSSTFTLDRFPTSLINPLTFSATNRLQQWKKFRATQKPGGAATTTGTAGAAGGEAGPSGSASRGSTGTRGSPGAGGREEIKQLKKTVPGWAGVSSRPTSATGGSVRIIVLVMNKISNCRHRHHRRGLPIDPHRVLQPRACRGNRPERYHFHNSFELSRVALIHVP